MTAIVEDSEMKRCRREIRVSHRHLRFKPGSRVSAPSPRRRVSTGRRSGEARVRTTTVVERRVSRPTTNEPMHQYLGSRPRRSWIVTSSAGKWGRLHPLVGRRNRTIPRSRGRSADRRRSPPTSATTMSPFCAVWRVDDDASRRRGCARRSSSRPLTPARSYRPPRAVSSGTAIVSCSDRFDRRASETVPAKAAPAEIGRPRGSARSTDSRCSSFGCTLASQILRCYCAPSRGREGRSGRRSPRSSARSRSPRRTPGESQDLLLVSGM